MKSFFISIPHSGERVPPEVTWLHSLPEPILMCDVDRYVDRLYAPVVEALGFPCVKTEWHRYVVDLNRIPTDVDADSVQGSSNPSGRFTTGLHWVKTTRGMRLMPHPISQDLHTHLVERYFEPFHHEIRSAYRSFFENGAQKVYQLDAHSMPSKGTSAHRDPGQERADIVVSDQEGSSCETEYKDLVMEAYRRAGLRVAYNWPYLGGRVTQVYGRPKDGQHALQVEINRSLYMDEESKQLVPDKAERLSAQISQAVRYIYSNLPVIGDKH
ncbi:MAG: N-formylglutamate amidohydrolase [Bdellovibrionales bacterium]